MASVHKPKAALAGKGGKTNPLPGRKPSKAFFAALDAVEKAGKKKKTS